MLSVTNPANEGMQMTAQVVEPPSLIAVEEAARLLGIGRSTTYELVRMGVLRSVKIGRRRLIPRTAINDAIVTLASETGDTR